MCSYKCFSILKKLSLFVGAILGASCNTSDNGNPHDGHDFALSDISFPHSLRVISAILLLLFNKTI